MDFKTHWKFDDFYPDAAVMRKKIDEHFDDSIGKHLSFAERTRWNYWYIPNHYTYLRADPPVMFTESIYEQFMEYLQAYVARFFGMFITFKPTLSMYINGCGQVIHNDVGNGKLGFVYSLTNWNTRRFLGGETIIYAVGDRYHDMLFAAKGGFEFYDAVEPLFNRLLVFDDRLPHAVEFIKGNMDPTDARFVLHGHFEEMKEAPAFVEGGLEGIDVASAFQECRSIVQHILATHTLQGFVTFEVDVAASGNIKKINLICSQLLSPSRQSDMIPGAVDALYKAISIVGWPETAQTSTLVFAISASPT